MTNHKTRATNSLVVATLRQLETRITLEAEERRASAGWHALEAMESDNQDAEHQLAEAKRLAAEASGLRAARDIVRDMMHTEGQT